jgi:hypothetical protein
MEQIMEQMNKSTYEMYQCIERESELMQQKRSDAESNPLRRMSTIDRVHAQGHKKSVKYMNAARVLAEPYGHAQLLMEAMLQKNGKGRDKLEKNFQDCKILARTTQLLNEIQTMDPEVATDERFDRCRQGCEQVQKVLEDQDAGLGDRFRFELEEQRKKVERFLTTGVDQDVEEKAEAAAKAVADAEAKAAADAKAVADAEAKAEAEAKDKAKAPQQSYVLTDADTRWSPQQSHVLTSGKHDLERNVITYTRTLGWTKCEDRALGCYGSEDATWCGCCWSRRH